MPARPQGADYHHASQILLTPLLTYSDRMDRIYSNSQSSRLELAEFAPIPWSMCSWEHQRRGGCTRTHRVRCILLILSKCCTWVVTLQLCQMHIGIAGKRSAADKAGALSYGHKVDVSADKAGALSYGHKVGVSAFP